MAAGDLDLGFGTNGIVTTDFNTDFQFSTRISRILVERNRGIVAAGTASGRFVNCGALARYDSKGNLDPTFGFRVVPSHLPGTLLFNFGGAPDSLVTDGSRLFGLAPQADGKLIVVGDSSIPPGAPGEEPPLAHIQFSVARLNPDGHRDTVFGEGNSFPQIDFVSPESFARDVVVRGDRCVVAGSAFKQDTGFSFALAAFDLASGNLDFDFGKLGKVITDLGSSGDQAFSMVEQRDPDAGAFNKIVVGGHVGNRPGDGQFALVRYDASTGVLDTTFGKNKNGTVITDFGDPGTENTLGDLAVQEDRKIIAVGGNAIPPGRNSRTAMARYHPDGDLDLDFGNKGRVLECLDANPNPNLPCNSGGGPVALQPQDDKIVVAVANGLARFNTNGTLDQTFGTGGMVALPAGIDGISSIAFQVERDEHGDKVVKILAGGSASGSPPSGHSDFALVRYVA
jgi:uncharacterized delta-60 repeat protein